MATGMEKMLASMLGVTPEQMQETINNSLTLLNTVSERFERLETKMDFLIEHLTADQQQPERTDNGGQTNDD